jgi:uncharacterized protein HemX
MTSTPPTNGSNTVNLFLALASIATAIGAVITSLAQWFRQKAEKKRMEDDITPESELVATALTLVKELRQEVTNQRIELKAKEEELKEKTTRLDLLEQKLQDCLKEQGNVS